MMAGANGGFFAIAPEVRRTLLRTRLRTAQIGADMAIGPTDLPLAVLRLLVATRCDQADISSWSPAQILSRSLRCGVWRLTRKKSQKGPLLLWCACRAALRRTLPQQRKLL